MKILYYLEHNYKEIIDNGEVSDNAKFLGIYSTREKAESDIKHYITLPGFKDYPNDFYINEYELDKNYYEDGFELLKGITSIRGYVGSDDDNYQDSDENIVFLLQNGFAYTDKEDYKCEETRILGVYSTWEKGISAKQYYKTLPGFKDLPNNCFYLGDYLLNYPTIWGGGFVIKERE